MQDKHVVAGIVVAAIAVGAIVLFSGSKSPFDTSSVTTNDQSSAVIVPFTTITQGRQSAVAERVNYSITSVDQLAKLWKLIGATSTPPTVDFTTHMVLAVFAGNEPSSSIAIAKIEDTNARLVSIEITKLDGTCAEKQSSVTPYEIVTVSTTALPLTHEDLSTTVSCK